LLWRNKGIAPYVAESIRRTTPHCFSSGRGRSTTSWIEPTNILSKDKQIDIIATLCEGNAQRAVARMVDVDRKTVARLALQVGKGCAELHDRRVVGVRVARLELDEAWSYVAKKQKRVKPHEAFAKGDQYVFTAGQYSEGNRRLSHRQARQRRDR